MVEPDGADVRRSRRVPRLRTGRADARRRLRRGRLRPGRPRQDRRPRRPDVRACGTWRRCCTRPGPRSSGRPSRSSPTGPSPRRWRSPARPRRGRPRLDGSGVGTEHEAMASWERMVHDLSFRDLHHPWFASGRDRGPSRPRPSAGSGRAAPRRRRPRRSRCAAPRRRAARPAPGVDERATSSSVRPPSGPTTSTIVAGGRDVDRGQRPVAASCRTSARSASRQPARTTSAVVASGATSGATPGGPAWRPRGRSPATSRRDFAARSPFQTATLRAAAHGTIGCDADLGEHLDRELAAVALGERLHDDQPRASGRGSWRRRRPDREHPLAGRVTVAGRRRPGAVGEHDLLPHPQPAYGHGVVGLVAGHLDRRSGLDPGERRHQVDRQASSAHASVRWLNASRSRPKTDLRPGPTWPVGCSSPRIAASSRSSSSWRASSRVGVSTTMVHDEVAARRRAGRGRRARASPARRRTGCRAGSRARSWSRAPERRPRRRGRPRGSAASAWCRAPPRSSAP